MKRIIALIATVTLMLASVGALAGNGTQQRDRKQAKDGSGENCTVDAVVIVLPAVIDGNGNGAGGSGGNGDRQQKRDGSCTE